MKDYLVQLYDNRQFHPLKNTVNSEDARIIYAYRYLSWSLTSFVYLMGNPNSLLIFKSGVILSLLISSILFTDLYMKFKQNTKAIKTLILSETLGIIFLLLSTGGLTSPFIWYALNPTLVAASYLPTFFCWINLVLYLFAGSIMTYYVFNPDHMSLLTILVNNYNLALAFVLITIIVLLLARLTNKLSLQAHALLLSNEQKQESMNNIMTLYQIIEAVDNHSTKDSLFKTLAAYTSTLMNSELSIYWFPSTLEEDEMIYISKSIPIEEQQQLLVAFRQIIFHQETMKEINKVKIGNYHLLTIPIFISTAPCGLIATLEKEHLDIDELDQSTKLLEYLSALCSVTLERFHIEDTEDHLLVIEEQNRIANEIHDSVSQRLFSISYGLYGLVRSWENMTRDQIQSYLLEIHDSSKLAMEELRNSIYKLSSKKKGEKSLSITLKAFLDSIAKLHHIIINFNINGDELILSLKIKQVITRIIREACGNAIRHGLCNMISLDLNICPASIRISIQDNGKGFYMKNDNPAFKKGLGLSNMKNLIASYNGTMDINSEFDNGTKLLLIIPLNKDYIDRHQERKAI